MYFQIFFIDSTIQINEHNAMYGEKNDKRNKIIGF